MLNRYGFALLRTAAAVGITHLQGVNSQTAKPAMVFFTAAKGYNLIAVSIRRFAIEGENYRRIIAKFRRIDEEDINIVCVGIHRCHRR